ncbi:solute carrier family 35 member C2 [Eurytemora carolleeae]|uniref:solute carrier family 35 member C2 n=1 Tax=Eurytemora carolleeae TaxID=1294199 RepID=UPI000C791E91|nr:solute carrier family 35 member C2 [Eurytemora carolleeae]|eukprot:XP_023336208.1 solute carrier family 35 member C2-like [Eurytemora affinis]
MTKGLLNSAKEKGERLREKGGKMAVNVKKEVRISEIRTAIRSRELWKMAIRTLLLVMFYFATSIGLTFYQSYLLKKIHFPMLIVSVHFLIKLLLAWVSRLCYRLVTGNIRITIGWRNFIGRVGLVALVASLDIGLSQWSLEYIQVALYTVTKSTSIIFILFFAIIFGVERKHWSLIFIVLTIATGLIMFTYKSSDFNIIGFFMVLSASFLSGIRWTLSQLIMQRSNQELSNPIDMIFHIQPIMFITILPFVIGFEGPNLINMLGNIKDYNMSDITLDASEIVAGKLFISFISFSYHLKLSYWYLRTYYYRNNAQEKGLLTMSLAVIYQSTDLSVINLIGLMVCLLGISMHVLKKATETQRVNKSFEYKSGRKGEIDLPLLSDSDMDSEEELYRGSSGEKRKFSFKEDILLRDNREWTSVRDMHVESAQEMQDSQSSSYRLEDSMRMEEINENENEDALMEADKLLHQLDLLSSS